MSSAWHPIDLTPDTILRGKLSWSVSERSVILRLNYYGVQAETMILGCRDMSPPARILALHQSARQLGELFRRTGVYGIVSDDCP